MKIMQIASHAIDWFSVKLTGVPIAAAILSHNTILIWLGGLSAITTIVYNGIRIYKEVKTK